MKLLILTALLFIGACQRRGQTSDDSRLSKYEDKENGVVCYSVSGYKDISCVKVTK